MNAPCRRHYVTGNRGAIMNHIGYKRMISILLSALLLISLVPAVRAAEPQQTSLTDGLKVDAGSSMTAFIKSDKSLWMCGNNYYGQLGADSVKSQESVRTPVKVMENVIDVSCGGFSSAAVTADGKLWTWGHNEYGQLGIGDTEDRDKPVQVAIPENKKVVSVCMDGDYAAAITEDGMLYTWGLNTCGRLGQNNSDFLAVCLTPTPIFRNVKQVSLSNVNAAAVTTDGKVMAWGSNVDGVLGIPGAPGNCLVPLQVQGIGAAESVSAGYGWTAAVTEDHQLYTWGRKDVGQIGNGQSGIDDVTTPCKILDGVVSVCAGNSSGAAITEDQELLTWGQDLNGKLGQGSVKKSLAPAQVMTEAIQVSCRGDHMAVIDKDGYLWTCGWNGSGQLAISGNTKTKPVKIMNLLTGINTYKLATVAGENARYHAAQTFLENLDSVGGGTGGLASQLHQTYQESLRDEINGAWDMIQGIGKLLNGDVSSNDRYRLVLSDLLTKNYGLDYYTQSQTEAVLSNLSDLFTGFQVYLDNDAAKTVREVLEQIAFENELYGEDVCETLNNALSFLGNEDLAKLTSEASGKVSDMLSLFGAAVQSAEDLWEAVNKYVLYQSMGDTASDFAAVLRDAAAETESLTSDGDKIVKAGEQSKASAALYAAADDIYGALADDPSRLFQKAGGSLANLRNQTAVTVLSMCYEETLQNMPWITGAKLGLQFGVPIANKATDMDSISYYGGMLNSTGLLAEGLYQVVVNRLAIWENDNSYANAAALKSATELYFSLQILACDYAIGYNNAIIDAAVATKGSTADEEATVDRLGATMDDLYAARDASRRFFDGEEVTSYVIQCPVTVIVEDLNGNVIAKQSTGSQTVAEGYEGFFHLLGEDLSSKSGYYNPATMRLRAEGNGTGEMDALLFTGTGDGAAKHQRYENLPVTDGSIYTFTEDSAILDGETVFHPAEDTPLPVNSEEISVTGSTMDYSIILPSDGRTARLIAAWYNADGKLLGTSTDSVPCNGQTPGNLPVAAGQSTYRLFVLDSETSKPLTKALRFPIE